MRKLVVSMTVVGLFASACGGGGDVSPPPAVPPPASATASAPAEPPAPPPPAPPSPEMIAKAILGYMAAFNAGEPEKAVAAFHSDGKWVSAGSLVEPATGPVAIAQGWKELRSIFDIKVNATRVFVSEGMWVAQGVLSGSHVGAFHGLAPTKKPVAVEYVHIATVTDGKVKELVSLSNGLAFPRQIGFTKGDPIALPAIPTGEPEIVTTKGDPASYTAAESVLDALAKGDLASVKASLSDKVRLVDKATGKTAESFDAAAKQATGMAKGWSNVTRAQKGFAAGPYVVVTGNLSGTYEVPVGKGKTEKMSATVYALDVVKMEGGKVVSIESYRNPKELLDLAK